MPWPLFLMLLQRVGRFKARALLGQIVASGHGTPDALGELPHLAFPTD